MLLFDCRYDGVYWGTVSNDRLTDRGVLTLVDGIPDQRMARHLIDTAEAIGYVWMHGSDYLNKPVERLTLSTLSKAESSLPFLPAPNRWMLNIAQIGFQRRPTISHVIYSETAIFEALPEQSRHLALPGSSSSMGLFRFGGDGLCHAWGWQQASRITPGLARLVSVHLSSFPSVVAFHDGKPVETSMGFTSLDGIPGETSSGNLDPGVVLTLVNNGYSTDRIEHVLESESGWQVISDRRSGWKDIFSGQDDVAAKLVGNALLKGIGMCLAALGGAQTIIFLAEEIEPVLPFISFVAEKLSFTGMKIGVYLSPENDQILTTPEPTLEIIAIPYPRYLSLHELAHNERLL